MKKVMKKFNRALSIMLVAAMVITMAPTTAMPVLAAEPEVEAEVVDVPAAEPTEEVTEPAEPVVEETGNGSENEQKEPEEDDNETPVIETETPSEETPVEETPEEPVEVTPEEPVETPEETPVEETPEEGDVVGVDLFDVIDEADTPITFAFTVNGTSSTDTTFQSYITDTDGITDNKIDKAAAASFKVTIPDDVELELAPSDAVKLNGTAMTAESDGSYKIAENSVSDASVEIIIALVTKTYTVNAPNENTTDGVSWKIRANTTTEWSAATASVKVPKATAPAESVSLQLQATLAAGKPSVVITVDEVEKTLTKNASEGVTETFDVTVPNASLGTTAVSLEATYEVIAEVTLKAAEPAADNAFTGEYAIKKSGAKVYGAWATIPTGMTITGVAAGDTVGLKLTATSAGKAIKSVTAGSNVLELTNEGYYEYAVVAPGTTGANEITVETMTAKTITVTPANANTKIETVSYKVGTGSSTNALKTATGWTISVDASNTTNKVTITVTPADHNQVTYICKGETHGDACTAAGNDLFVRTDSTVGANGEATAIDLADVNNLALKVATEKITVDYTLVDSAGLVSKITDASGNTVAKKAAATTPTAPETGTDDDEAATAAGTYVLNDGETYYVVISNDNLAKLKSIKATAEEDAEAATALNKYAGGFKFVASAKATGEALKITVEAKTAEAQELVVEYADDDSKTFKAKIKADEYKTGEGADDKASDVAESEIKVADSAVTATYYNVWEDTAFTFAVTPADNDYYTITKVVYVPTGGDEEELTADATTGKYKIEKAKAGTIKVTVALDPTKAESITFAYTGSDLTKIEADLAGGATWPAEAALTTLKPGETKSFKKDATSKAIKFKVTAQDGYKVKEVKNGETEIKAVSGVYTVNYTDAVGDTTPAVKNVTVTITTEADAEGFSADKYVTLKSNNENVTIANIVGATADENGVYKLTAPQVANEATGAAAVAGIFELAFDLIVPHGMSVASDLDITGVRRTDNGKRTLAEGKWKYSYKIVASQITGIGDKDGSSAEKAIVIEIPEEFAGEEFVTVKMADDSGVESVEYVNLDNPDNNDTEIDSTGISAHNNDRILVTLPEGATATVNGGEPEELDEEDTFILTAKLDDTAEENATEMEINVTTVTAAEHVVKYAVNPANTASPEYEEAGKDAITADIGDKIYVKVLKAGESEEAETLTKAVVVGEGAKSIVDTKDKGPGEAVITVADEDFSVDFYYEKPIQHGTAYTEYVETKAATITIAAKNAAAAGTEVTVKGVAANGKTVLKYDATTETRLPITFKRNKKAVAASEYIGTLVDPVVTNAEGVTGDVAKVTIDPDTCELVIKTLQGGKAQATVQLFAKGQATSGEGATPLVSFKIEGQTPALKVSKVESPNQGYKDLLVDVTADKGVKTVNSEFKLFYEINIKGKDDNTAASTGDGYYYLEAENNGKGGYNPVSQLFTVNGVTEATKDQAENNKYTVSARLVAVNASDVAANATALGGGKTTQLGTSVVKFATATAVSKEFATKKMNYEAKLGVTKKTTKFYSGQTGVTVAIPKFSKDAGYINDISAEVYDKDGSLASGVTADVDEVTMAVTVNSGDYTAGNYDVVIYATAHTATETVNGNPSTYYDMYQASAKVPITVQKAINYIDVQKTVEEILIPNYGDAKKAKAASFTVKPVGYYTTYVKAQTQKFDYKVTNLGNNKNTGKVTVKNGKVTVAKDFYISNDPTKNTVTVTVYAADYTGNYGNEGSSNGRVKSFTFTVTKTAREPKTIQLRDYGGNKAYADGATISADTLSGLYVVIKDANGKEIPASMLTITPSSGKIYVNSSGQVRLNGFAKTVTIKATTTDGGKKSASAKFNVTQKGGKFVLANWDNDEGEYGAYKEGVAVGSRLVTPNDSTNPTKWTYSGANDDVIAFTITEKTTDGVLKWAPKSYYNYTVKITGGKNTYKYSDSDGYYTIAPTAATVKVAITDKTVKGAKPVEYTIENENWSTQAAPSVSTKDKLYQAYAPSSKTSAASIKQDLTYTVKNNKNNYTAVQLTYVSGSGIDHDSCNLESIYEIKSDGTFKLENVVVDSIGTEKYTMVFGTKDAKDNFIPKTKAANLSIKTNKVGAIKLTAKYTISTNVSYGVDLAVKPALSFKNIKVDDTTVAQKLVQYDAKVLSANVKGQPNKFAEYFEIVDDRLQIKDGKRTAEQLAALTKDDYTGYVVYRYALGTDAYSIVEKKDKVTVTVNEKGSPKYAATPINVVSKANTTATTTITLGGQPVNIAKVAAEGDVWAASIADGDAGKGIVTLKAASPASGKMNLYVIPVGSKGASDSAVTGKEAIIANGIKVTVDVKTVAEDDTKSWISVGKKAKVPGADDAAIIAGNDTTPGKVMVTATFTEGTDFSYLWDVELDKAEKVTAEADIEKLTKQADKDNAAKIESASYTKRTAETPGKIEVVFDRDVLKTTNGKTTYAIPLKLTFGTRVEYVNFSIQPQKAPTMGDVEKLVKGALDNYPVSADSFADGSKAAAEIKTALNDITIPALSGITVNPATDVTADENFSGKDATETAAAVAASHKIIIKLTDVTKAAPAADATDERTKSVEITVTEKTTLAGEIKKAFDKWRVEPDNGTLDSKYTKITETTPTYAEVRDALQKAVDTVYGENLYIVYVSDITREKVEVTTPPSAGTSSVDDDAEKTYKVTSMTVTWTITNLLTKEELKPAGEEACSLTAAKGNNGTVEVKVPEEKTTTPGGEDDPTTETVTVRLNVDDAEHITYVGWAETASNATTAPETFTNVTLVSTIGTFDVTSGKKLWLKITAADGYTAAITDKTIGDNGVCEYGEISTATTIAITTTGTTTQPGGGGSSSD